MGTLFVDRHIKAQVYLVKLCPGHRLHSESGTWDLGTPGPQQALLTAYLVSKTPEISKHPVKTVEGLVISKCLGQAEC